MTDVAISAEQPMNRPAGETVAPVSLPSATPAADTGRRRRALHQELAVRAGVALLMLGFNQILTVAPAVKGFIRVAAVLGLLVNVPYYLAARSNWPSTGSTPTTPPSRRPIPTPSARCSTMTASAPWSRRRSSPRRAC